MTSSISARIIIYMHQCALYNSKINNFDSMDYYEYYVLKQMDVVQNQNSFTNFVFFGCHQFHPFVIFYSHRSQYNIRYKQKARIIVLHTRTTTENPIKLSIVFIHFHILYERCRCLFRKPFFVVFYFITKSLTSRGRFCCRRRQRSWGYWGICCCCYCCCHCRLFKLFAFITQHKTSIQTHRK